MLFCTLGTLVLLVYSNSSVQTKVARYAASWLSGQIHSKVQIDSLTVTGLHTFTFKHLYVQDLSGDTLLLAPSLKIELLDYHNLNLAANSLTVESLDLRGGEFYLHKNSKGILNLDFLIDYFSGSAKPATDDLNPFILQVRKIRLVNSHYRMEDEKAEKKLPPGIFNTNDFDIKGINLEAKNFYLRDDSILADVRHLSLHEKCGFKLLDLQTQFNVGDHHMAFNKLLIKTPNSLIGDHYEMHYKNIAAFDEFQHNVYLIAHLSHAHVAAKDIAYFSHELKQMNLTADITASGRGKLENLKIRNIDFHTGHNTYISGNFRIKGLPDLETTFMDLDLTKFRTSLTDAHLLLRGAGLSQLIKQIPKELTPLGKIEYTGNFDGFYNDFVARGKFRTAIGNLSSDINLKFHNGKLPVYRGNITTDGFELGKLLGEPDLGKISVNANVSGSGFNQFAGRDTIDTHFNFIDFQGYRYNGITVKGARVRKRFDGQVSIADANLGLHFNGSVNLNGKIPAYDFKATILHADLRRLKFLKDSIELSTQLEVKASGSNLTNLQGNILVTQTGLKRNGVSYKIDSLDLLASTHNGERTISLHSCLLDGSVTGKYDLATFPSAVKAIFAHYIPSITGNRIVHSSSQNFEFNLNVYDADPILAVFAPDYHIAGTAIAQGRFNAVNGQFSTSGNIHELDIGNLEFNSVSFEGENEEKQHIDLSISVDSIRSNHKILARNINIFNNIRKDSLMFNVKVSDVNAVNHLDLNGHLAFADKVTSLSILPSELVLDRQAWNVDSSFKVRFEKDLVRVINFNIHHNNESLTVNGPLSANPGDTLVAQFKNFNIAAVNQLLREENLELNGNLNGKAYLSSVTHKLSFHSDLGIDSLGINKIYIGTLALVNSWDGDSKTIDFTGKIHRKLINVMNLQGVLGFSDAKGSIDASLQLNKAEAVILQPVVGDLVSDLKGTISSDLHVSGSVVSPIIDGQIKLENTEFTINYLKTHYRINDVVNFENGNIHIKNLLLTDPYYIPSRPQVHTAYLNGDIDLTELSHPYFDAVVHANNFLCLNTVERDNELYYGTAYSSGDFSFVGPIETMNIDISAITNKNTTFNIPLNRPSSVGVHDYINFVNNPDSMSIAKKHKNLHTGVTLNFNLNITPDATVKLDFDKSIGDEMRGAGSSDMNLQITPEGDFLMYGTYEIDHGDYLFTSANVLNKLFTVERGGSIRFTGEPLNAQLNLHADYQARTSVRNLYDGANVQPTNQGSLDQSVLVACRINLEGNLSHPTFDFDLLFPNDPNINYDLQTYLSSNDVVTTQSLLFLASNQFNGKLTPSNGVAILTSTGVQYVSSQLSHLVNNFSNRLDLNFRSLSDVGINYHFLNDRILFTGNIASTDTTTSIGYNPLALTSNKNIEANFELAYALTKNRNFTARAFFKPVPQDIHPVNLGQNIVKSQGVGLVYQKDFSSLRSIFNKQKATGAPKLPPLPSLPGAAQGSGTATGAPRAAGSSPAGVMRTPAVSTPAPADSTHKSITIIRGRSSFKPAADTTKRRLDSAARK